MYADFRIGCTKKQRTSLVWSQIVSIQEKFFIQSLHHTKNRCAALKQSINSFEPFIRTIISWHLDCQMGEPAVRGCTVPVFHACRNVDTVAGVHFNGGFPPFLIEPSPCDTNQNLAAPFVCVMDMPVIAALNWTTPPQSLVVTGFNGVHVCALCKPFVTSSFCQVTLSRPRSKPLLQG